MFYVRFFLSLLPISTTYLLKPVMMQRVLVYILFAIIGLSAPLPIQAEENDSAFNELYHRFIKLYNSKESPRDFYEIAEELCDYYRKNDNPQAYYKTQLNICFYDIDRNQSLDALKRANHMLEEMEKEKFDAYSQVYLALGTIFENCGNFRIARHYYDESLNTLNEEEKDNRINIYQRIAYLLMFRNPTEAEYWNKKARTSFENATSQDFKADVGAANFLQISMFVEAMINFAVNNKYGFQKSYQEYSDFIKKHDFLDNYGQHTMSIAQLAFDGKYEEALNELSVPVESDLGTVDNYDMRIIICKMMNRYDKALEWSFLKSEFTDSLHSDILFSNINELNVQIGLEQTKSKANQTREILMYIILVLAIIVITLLVLYILHNKKRKEMLKQKNEQLHTALTMAEESEKMKTEFVRSVSHEIRTPLNAINGFNDILNTPGIELSEEERADLLQRIKENVKAITDIVDEMLRVSEKESNELYSKHNKIFCNQFFSSLIYQYRDTISSSVELKFTSRILNRFQIDTNEEGVKKIVEQLLLNAMKFTKSGFIELHCELTDNGKTLAVSVTDTGKGIAEDQQDKIFEGFYKEDMFQQGIGLGLTVSKKIAVKLGGDVVLDKDYKEGARFILTLPV